MTRDEAIEFIQQAHFGFLATVDSDGKSNVRPVGMHTIYGDNFYFFTFATTPKVSEIRSNPCVSVVWADTGRMNQVRMKGTAHVEDDPAIINRFKAQNPIVQKMLPPGAEHLFVLYRVEPERIQAARGLVPYVEVNW